MLRGCSYSSGELFLYLHLKMNSGHILEHICFLKSYYSLFLLHPRMRAFAVLLSSFLCFLYFLSVWLCFPLDLSFYSCMESVLLFYYILRAFKWWFVRFPLSSDNQLFKYIFYVFLLNITVAWYISFVDSYCLVIISTLYYKYRWWVSDFVIYYLKWCGIK